MADRGNRRILIFDQDGKQLDTWYQFSRISGLYIDRNDTLYAIDLESDDDYNPGWRKGLRVGSARTGEVWYSCPSTCRNSRRAWAGSARLVKAWRLMPRECLRRRSGPIQGLTKFIPRLKR